MVPRNDEISVALSIIAKIFEKFRSCSTVLHCGNMVAIVTCLLGRIMCASEGDLIRRIMKPSPLGKWLSFSATGILAEDVEFQSQ